MCAPAYSATAHDAAAGAVFLRRRRGVFRRDHLYLSSGRTIPVRTHRTVTISIRKRMDNGSRVDSAIPSAGDVMNKQVDTVGAEDDLFPRREPRRRRGSARSA